MAVVALGVLAGCSTSGGTSSDSGSDSNEKPITVGMVFDTGGRGDKSFNDSAYRGIERAEKELGIMMKTVDSKAVSDYEKNLTILAQNKVPLIIAVGISMKEAVTKVAPKFPDIQFALVDDMVDSPNVRGLKFKEEEGSFMAGYLAGLMTKSGKIGFVGGEEIPLIKRFEVGYIAGAKTANPNLVALPAKYTASWNDAALGKQCAKTLFGQGADIVYHASGGCGRGVIEAAKETGKFAIGVDSDQDYLAEGRVLTSMVKRVDEAVFSTIADFKNGKFTGGEMVYDLKSKGVGLSEMKYTKDLVGEENLAKLAIVEKQIVEGTIRVPATESELQSYLKELKK